jgi:alkanesulfonate monooxygenase SsuD/methylene tetrahydromethanopterin reductase-like flavin-dependent oxidoreductase (luciferase family)
MSDGTRISVLFPHHVQDLGELTGMAKLVRAGAARRLWLGQSLTVESNQALAYLAGAGFRIPVGLSVALTALRHPYDAAAQARSLALLTGHPPVVGYGAGEPLFVGALHGAPYDRPASAVAEYVGVMRALLKGGPVTHEGRTFRLGGAALPALRSVPAGRNTSPAPDPAGDRDARTGAGEQLAEVGAGTPLAEVGAGVLRPGMARAAGRSADVAISWLTPPSYVQEVLVPALEEGARAAGRPRPRLVTVVHAAVARPGRSPLPLAQRGTDKHLRVHHYADMLRRAGLDVDVSDPVSGARELVEAGVFLYGKPGDLAREFERYFEAGADEVVINPLAVAQMYGFPAALTDLTEILAACG